jgi:hypothetical protein
MRCEKVGFCLGDNKLGDRLLTCACSVRVRSALRLLHGAYGWKLALGPLQAIITELGKRYAAGEIYVRHP